MNERLWTCHECGAEMYGFENCQFCGAHKGGGEAMSMYGDNSTKEWLYEAIEGIRGEYENEMDFIADLAAILAEYLERNGYGQNGW